MPSAIVRLPDGRKAKVRLPDGGGASATAATTAQGGQLAAQAAQGVMPGAPLPQGGGSPVPTPTPTPGPADAPGTGYSPAPAPAPSLGEMATEGAKRLVLGATDVATFPAEVALWGAGYTNFGEVRRGVERSLGLEEPESAAGGLIATILENLGGGPASLAKTGLIRGAKALAKLNLKQLAKLEAASAVASAAGEEGLAAIVGKDSSYEPYARLIGALTGVGAAAAARPAARYASARMRNPRLGVEGVLNQVPEDKLALHMAEVSDLTPAGELERAAQLERIQGLREQLAPIGYEPSLQSAVGDPGFETAVRQQSAVSGEFRGAVQRRAEDNLRRIYTAVKGENPLQEGDVGAVTQMLQKDGDEFLASLARIERDAGEEGVELVRALDRAPTEVALGDTIQDGLGQIAEDFRLTSEAAYKSIGVNDPAFKAPVPAWSPQPRLKAAVREVLKQEEAVRYSTEGELLNVKRTAGTSTMDLTDPLRPLRALMAIPEPRRAEAGVKAGQMVGGPTLGDLKDALHYVGEGARTTRDKVAKFKYEAAREALREELKWLQRGGLTEQQFNRYTKAVERARKLPDGSMAPLPKGVPTPVIPPEVARGAQELEKLNAWFGVKVRPLRDDRMSAILARSKQGRDKLTAESVASQLTSDVKGIRNYRELREAFTENVPSGDFTPDGTPIMERVPHPALAEMDNAIDLSLQRRFLRENTNPSTGALNGAKALQWLADNKEILADYSDTAERLRRIARKKVIWDTQQFPVLERARGDWEASTAAKLSSLARSPEAVMEELSKLSPAKRAMEFRDMAAKAQKHSDPGARMGVQKLAIELVRRDAGMSAEDFWGNPTLGGEAFVKAIRENQATLREAGYTPERIRFLEALGSGASVETNALRGLRPPVGDLEALHTPQKIARAAIRGSAWVRGNPKKVLSIALAAGGEAAALTIGNLSADEVRSILLRATYDEATYKALMNLARKSADPPATLRSLRSRLTQMGARAAESSLDAQEAEARQEEQRARERAQ